MKDVALMNGVSSGGNEVFHTRRTCTLRDGTGVIVSKRIWTVAADAYRLCLSKCPLYGTSALSGRESRIHAPMTR